MSMFPIYTGEFAGGEVRFSNIPQTFEHLQIRVFGRSAYNLAVGWSGLYFNDTPATGSYPAHSAIGNGSAAVGSGFTGFNQIIPDTEAFPSAVSTANVYANLIWDIYDYASTSRKKTVRALQGYENNISTGRVSISSGAWDNTSAISTIQVSCIGGFASGSRVDLYGITSNTVTGA